MNTNVLNFPELRNRAWALQERHLRAALVAASQLSALEVDYVCSRLRPVYLRATEVPPFSGTTVDEALQALNGWVVQCTQEFFLAFVAYEVELAQLRGTPMVPPPQPQGCVQPLASPQSHL